MALNKQEFERLKGILSTGNSIPQTTSGRKFIENALPIGGMILGGIGGGIVAGPPGAIAGAGVGGAGAELLKQKITGQPIQSKEILGTGIESAAGEALGGILVKGAGTVVKPLLEKGGGILKWAGKEIKPLTDVIKTGLQGIKKVLPGVSDDTALTITRNANKVEALATRRSLPVNYIIDDVVKVTDKFEKQLGNNYEKQWQKLLAEGNKYTYDKNTAINSINKFLETESKKGNIFFKLDKAGKLDFSASPFTKSQQQNVIKAMVDEINTAKPKNIAEIRALKQRLNAIYQEYSSQFGANPQLNRVVTNMVKSVDEALPQALRNISKEYSEGLNFINTVEELLLPVSPTTGSLKGTTVSKIKSMGKEELKELYGDFLKDFKAKTGYDLETELDIYNAAREINPNLIPQDTGGIIRGIQRAANPFVGMLKIKQAQGLLPTTGGIIEKIGTAYGNFKPVVDFIKDTTIPAAVKTEVFLTLQDLFKQK